MHSSSEEIIFSIIIPMYNAGSYIINCLNSILAQSYNSYEIIIVDDGSNDGSYTIVEDYCLNKNNVHLYKQENSGTYNARLKGAKMAKGDYLLFVDADDEIRNDTLSFLFDVLANSSIDLVLYNLSRSSKFDDLYYSYSFSYHQVFDDDKYELFYLLLNGSSLNNLATKCISKGLFDSIGFKEIDDFCNAEDLYMSIQLIDKAHIIHFYNEALYYYRNNAGSVTHKYSVHFFDSIVNSNSLCVQIASQQNSDDLLLLSKQRACKSILVSIYELIQSNLSNEETQKCFHNIFSSVFFNEYKSYYSPDLSRIHKLLFLMMKYPNIYLNKTVLYLLRAIL